MITKVEIYNKLNELSYSRNVFFKTFHAHSHHFSFSQSHPVYSFIFFVNENQIKHFPPRPTKLHLIDEVMMYATGQPGRRGDGDDDKSFNIFTGIQWITISNFTVDLEALYPRLYGRDFTIKCASAILSSSHVCWASKDGFIVMEYFYDVQIQMFFFYPSLFFKQGGLHVQLTSSHHYWASSYKQHS